MITAAIVVSGTELLSGLHRDTNTGFIERRLGRLGIATRFAATAGDRVEEMAEVFRYALKHCDILLVSGGLGPTVDDLTREALSKATGVPLQESSEALDEVRARFRSFSKPMAENNRRQAMVPTRGGFLTNPHGTAPGLLFEMDTRLAIALPGPPRELEPMVESQIIPLLKERYPDLQEAARVRVRLVGMGESDVDHMLRVQVPVDTDIDLSLLARLGLVDVTLSLPSSQPTDLARLRRFQREIAEVFADYCYSTEIDEPLEAAVGGCSACEARQSARRNRARAV